MYLLRLADMCDVDMNAAVVGKMAKNARKYPAEQARGSSAKYHAYRVVEEQDVNKPEDKS